MGGRIYDADIGRFLQADPHIQAPLNSQNYNRYSYVLNNPMSYADPSGYFFKKLFKSIKKYWRTIASILVAVYLPSANFMSGWGAVGQGAFTGFVSGGIATGSLRGAIAGAITGALFGELHSMASGTDKVFAHGLVGGLGSVMNGGKFGHGFFSAGFTQSLGDVFDKATNSTLRMKNALKAALIGGTVSKLTGGKFANGAVTGAFSRLLNDDAGEINFDEISDEEKRKYAERVISDAKERLRKVHKALKTNEFDELKDEYELSNSKSYNRDKLYAVQYSLRKIITKFTTIDWTSSAAKEFEFRFIESIEVFNPYPIRSENMLTKFAKPLGLAEAWFGTTMPSKTIYHNITCSYECIVGVEAK